MKLESHKKYWLFGEESFKIIDSIPEARPIVNLSRIATFKHAALQIDGGGIKGILPAYALYATQFHTNKRKRKGKGITQDVYLDDIFTDYFGTSTGSIIVAGIYLGLNIRQLLNFYILEAPEVFQDRTLIGKVLGRTLFKAKKLEASLQEKFGDVTFKQARSMFPGKTLNIATVSRLERKTIICNFKNTPNMMIWEAVRASSAAPIYFPPYRYKNKVLLDGGTATYNSLLEKTLDYYMFDLKLKPKDYYILSLGCGTGDVVVPKYTERQTKKAMKARKLNALMFTIIYGRAETITRQVKKLKHLKEEMNINGMRWDILLHKDLDDMAETDNINELLEFVEKYCNK